VLPSSVWKIKQITTVVVFCLRVSIFIPEDGGSRFLRTASEHVPTYGVGLKVGPLVAYSLQGQDIFLFSREPGLALGPTHNTDWGGGGGSVPGVKRPGS
jgi:hypothetical protein